MTRIDKILARELNISRTQAKQMIKQGRVTADSQTVKTADFKCSDDAQIFVDGEKIGNSEFVYIMLNKPKGVISASDGKGEKTVVDLVPDGMKRKGLFPAGRLDKDTTGFVLITDDGDFAHRILSPKNHIFKTYLARLSHSLSENDISLISSGITLADGTTLKEAKLEIVEAGDTPLVKIMICEGKYHQVKRMFAAAGNKVVSLHRSKMGGLALDTALKPGECREITPSELEKITE